MISILTLRRCNEILLKTKFIDVDVTPQVLPDFDILEKGYDFLNTRWDTLIRNVSLWNDLQSNPEMTLRPYRRKNGGHPLARPMVVIAFVQACANLLDQDGDARLIARVSSYFTDLTVYPLRGLLWKENGGMHDGQRRRNAAACLFSSYLVGQPLLTFVREQWQGATGTELAAELPTREEVCG